MNTIARSEVLKLSLKERIKLVEDIWDSITEVPEAITLTEEQKKELDDRLEEYYQNPNVGSPWAMVREKFINIK
jgi:putative addiction module component (TIGR02574 family)